ncbi:restriction endonuclease subunit S [Acetatifactor muris]|uniref:EcoKI restriction-modification system protein HsdS n=1 Tax=Acetatifactor muris TaxID=879566 RepID=A0A2K4ZC26_9FIRM|nr:restriction endonuclease subunit S [Acetatifactor muris]MCR2046423.1 restriction endonuclease subunit S [Acetatifactor muris]SOY28008.1 EcoKI restriction-modification system protein HsdS [Acetatifactor muris]
MTEWKKCLISDIGTVVGGGTPSTEKRENYDGGTIPWITPKDLSNIRGRYISRGKRNITEEGLNNCSAQMMPKNTVLFSSRAPIGYIAIAGGPVCTNQGFKSIVPNEDIDSLFLYYLLKHKRDDIERMGSGTTFKEVSGNIMKNIQVCIPTLKKDQQKIASVLGALDDEIEENMLINDNLEQQAQAIYANMFIQDASNQRIEGVLSDVADITMGQSPKGDTYNENGVGTVFFQGRGEFGFRFPTRHLFTTDPKRMAQSNDVLMSVRAPVGDFNVAYEPCCIGRGLGAIRSKDNHQSFILYTVFSLRKKLDMFNGEGTVFGSINRDALKSIPIIIPTKEEMDQFEEIVAPMDASIRNNYEEICRLETIRDSVLPRLMSGELDVSALDI